MTDPVPHNRRSPMEHERDDALTDLAADRIADLERQLAAAIAAVSEAGRRRGEAEARLDRAVEALEKIADTASVPVQTWRNGINFKKMYEGWRNLATARIDVARDAIADMKRQDDDPA